MCSCRNRKWNIQVFRLITHEAWFPDPSQRYQELNVGCSHCLLCVGHDFQTSKNVLQHLKWYHINSVFRPKRAPNAMASAETAMWTPARSWLTIFIELPAPAPSLIMYSFSLKADRIAPTRFKASWVPAAIIVSFPLAALITPPDTGASKTMSREGHPKLCQEKTCFAFQRPEKNHYA